MSMVEIHLRLASGESHEYLKLQAVGTLALDNAYISSLWPINMLPAIPLVETSITSKIYESIYNV